MHNKEEFCTVGCSSWVHSLCLAVDPEGTTPSFTPKIAPLNELLWQSIVFSSKKDLICMLHWRESPWAWLYWNKRSSWCHLNCVKPKISALTLPTSFSLDPSQQCLPSFSAARVKSIKRKLAEGIFYIKQEIKHQKTLKESYWYSYLMYHLIQIISVYIYWNCLGWSMETGLDKTQMKSSNWFMLCKANTVPYKGFWHGLPFSNLCWLLSVVFVTFLWLEWFPGGFSP